MRIYRFGWKGVLFHSDSWLYIQPDSSSFLLAILMIVIYIPSLFLSYLKVSSTGLELHYWPLYRVCVDWDEIDRLGKCRALVVFPCDALYLKRAEASGKNAKIREWGLSKQCIIPLSDFHAWSSGELLGDLECYIPQVFLKKTVEAANHSLPQETTGIFFSRPRGLGEFQIMVFDGET